MLSIEELADALQHAYPMVVVDVREPHEIMQHGVISGALNIPLDELRHRMQDLPQHVPVVCVCASGIRAQIAVERLQAAGFERVYNVFGGMKRWELMHRGREITVDEQCRR